MIIYNIGVWCYETAIRIAGLRSEKCRLWAEGRKGLLRKIEGAVGRDDRIFWMHAASVGEFEQGRPVIEYVREHHPEYKILLTFYSSSGYELRKNCSCADFVFYFPSDTPGAARSFVDAIHPEIAVFVKYEFWLNTLSELRKRGTRTFLISSVFRPGSVFFRPWGGAWRSALGTFETVCVQDVGSKERLEGIGVRNVSVVGDTRFDRVMQIVRSARDIDIVSEFCAGSKVFVAGSTWGPDEELLIRLVNDNPDTKFIIAPHEINERRIRRIISGVKGGVARYTACPCQGLSDKQLLVIDTVGLLSAIYRYAQWAYIGGGFGVGIHNTVEPASYGLPLAFGPNYRKFNEAVSMVGLGIASPVRSYRELSAWFLSLKNDARLLSDTCAAARNYTESQIGATSAVLKIIGL